MYVRAKGLASLSASSRKCSLFLFFFLEEKSLRMFYVPSMLCPALPLNMGSPGASVVMNPPANAGDLDLTLGSGRSPGGGNDNPLQYSCLGNPMERNLIGPQSDMTDHLNIHD